MSTGVGGGIPKAGLAHALQPFTRHPGNRLDVTLFVDTSPSMALWRAESDAFIEVLGSPGVFGSFRLRRLDTSENPVLFGEPGEPAGGLVLVLTDGVAPCWRRGLMEPLLTEWTTYAAVTIVQLLPHRLWQRVGMPTQRARVSVSHHHSAPQWTVEDSGHWEDHGTKSGLTVPVIELAEDWLSRWASLTVGPGGQAAAILLATGTPVPRRQEIGSPEQQVMNFRRAASPQAFRLATLLAAGPVRLPVARAIQRDLVPDSHAGHLAEVLTSGLLRPPEGSDWQDATFEIDLRVRKVLLSGARRIDTARAVRIIADGFPTPGTDRLRRALSDPDRTPLPDSPLPDSAEPAEVEIEQAVLRALSGPYLRRAGLLAELIDAHHEESASAPGRASEMSRIWGGVPQRNPAFIGREETLALLENRLRETGTATLYGMSGIGKTQIAVEYLYRHESDYDLVWWVPAGQQSQIRAELTELAQVLKLEGVSEDSTAVPAVLETLRRGDRVRRWLLVFDTADSPDTVRPFVLPDGPGDILITSRNPDWTGIAAPVGVTLFDREESKAFLRSRGPEISDHDADVLAGKLGDLPLAIAQAVAWRAETEMPVREYLRVFDEKVTEILRTPISGDYDVSLAAVWNVAFDRLEADNPIAHRLLQLCAFFAPEPISRGLFTSAPATQFTAELDAALRNPDVLDDAVGHINRYGLAKIDSWSNTLQLHRLVQLVLRDRMSPAQQAEMRHFAHLFLASLDPGTPQSPENWPRYLDILPHAEASELLTCRNPEGRQLVLHLMSFQHFWGDHEGAAQLAERALNLWSQKLAEDDKQLLEARDKLSFSLWTLGRYAESAELNKETLKLLRRTLGGHHEETLLAELRVAGALKAKGDFLAARDMNEHTYRKAQAGSGERITIRAPHDLAVSLRLTGDFQRARELDEQTYRLRVRVRGKDSTSATNSYAGLILDHLELGDYAWAHRQFGELLARSRELYGANKAITLQRSHQTAIAARKNGAYASALELSGQALDGLRTSYGYDHPYTLRCAVSHAIDLRYSGDLEAAHRLGKAAFERYCEILDPNHPHTVAAAVDLAVTLRLLGEAEAARLLDEGALHRFRETFGPDQPYALAAAINLASDLSAIGDLDTAITIGHEAAARSQAILGRDHPTTLTAQHNTNLDLNAADHQPIPHYPNVLHRLRQALRPTHPTVLAATQSARLDCDLDLASM